MQGWSALVKKRDIQKSMNAIMPAKRRKAGLDQNMGIFP
jgi:hypothetical protein